MADLVMKQVVSVIDSRTSVVCLHAAGQIRPLSDPFDTLLGDQEDTPFHWRCRSMVIPWMPGFVSEARKLANAELLRRPLKQRRIGPGGETGHLPPRLPDNPPLPEGTSAIGAPTREQVDQFIDRTPDTTLLEAVPAEYRKDFVEANDHRFELSSNGGGISETYWVKDLQTGDRYVLKAGQYHNESVAEVIGTRLQNEVGFRSEVLVASDMTGGNGWVLLKHAEDMPSAKEAGYKVVGTGGSHGAIGKLGPRLEDPTEGVRKLLVDFAMDEADAKGGNLLLVSKDGGKTVRLAPIDRSLSQMGWRNAVEPGKTSVVTGDWSLAGRLKVRDLRAYMKTRGSPKGVLDLVASQADTAAGRQMIVETYDDVLASLKRVDLDDLTRGLPPELVEENRRLIADRIDALETNRATILRQMGVTDAAAAPTATRVLPEVLEEISDGRKWMTGLVEYEMAGARVDLPRFHGPTPDIGYDDMVAQMPAAMRALEEAFGALAEEFPGAMGKVMQVRMGQTAGRTAFAEYRSAYREVTIDWQGMADLPGLQAKFDQMIASGWLTKAAPDTGAVRYMIEHEMGHHFDGLLETLGDAKNDAWPTMWRKIGLEMRAAGLDVKSGTKARDLKAIKAYGTEHLSTYAGGDEKEFIAEAFAEYRLAANPGPVARIVGEAFEEAFGTGRKRPPAAALRTPAAAEADEQAAAAARRAREVAEEEQAAREQIALVKAAREAREQAEADAKRAARAAKAVDAKKAAAADPDAAMGTSTGLPYTLDRKPLGIAKQIAEADRKKYGDAADFMGMRAQGWEMMERALARAPKVRAEIESWVPEVRELVEDAANRVVVNVPASRLESLLKAGRWKSAFEAKTTAGKGVGGYLKARTFYEDVLMGLPDGIAKKERPIYGYVTKVDDLETTQIIEEYGNVHFVMKEQVLGRSTITLGDSLNGWATPRTLDEFKALPDWQIAREQVSGGMVWDIDDYESGAKEIPAFMRDLKPHDYVEAQVHGGLSLDDVESVIVDRSRIEKEATNNAKWAQEYAYKDAKLARDYQKDADAAAAELEAIDAMVVELVERGWNVVVR